MWTILGPTTHMTSLISTTYSCTYYGYRTLFHDYKCGTSLVAMAEHSGSYSTSLVALAEQSNKCSTNLVAKADL